MWYSRLTGEFMESEKCQLSGKVCIITYSLVLRGLDSLRLNFSVCFWADEQVKVKLNLF